jgi:uncharacterized protein DUF6636
MRTRIVARGVPISVIAVVALTLTSVGSGNGPSGVASPGGSTAGRCSLAEANAVAERLHLNDGLVVAKRVNRVLCGPFVGRGSNAMIASLSRETCLPNIGWAVFRFVGGNWQLIMKRDGFAILSRAGSDIREEVPIFRSGDSPCFPSGGERARIWHWNGSRLVAGPWKRGTPADTLKSGYFKTPSANIVCGHHIYTGSQAAKSSVGCRIKSGLKPPPPGTPPGCFSRNEVSVGVTGRASTGRHICPGEPEGDAGVFVFESQARVLAYGMTWSGGSIRCTSAETGLTCRNKSGHGFFLSRERWRTF